MMFLYLKELDLLIVSYDDTWRLQDFSSGYFSSGYLDIHANFPYRMVFQMKC